MERIECRTYKNYAVVAEKSAAEFQALINLITVPETWFFRDDEPFVYLAEYIHTVRLKNQDVRPLSILSLPCSSGEEPYTIAMVLRECGLAYSEFRIHAYDINGAVLEKARQGLYSNHSFRSANLAFRDRYFEREGEHYRLTEELRQAINFDVGNILTLAHLANGGCFDIIFCRNLLIYFDKLTQEQALTELCAVLSDHGRLFLGHAETTEVVLKRFESVGTPGSFVFAKRSRVEEMTEARGLPLDLAQAYRLSVNKVVVKSLKNSRRTNLSTSRKITPRANSLTTQSMLHHVEELANRGDLQEAARQCALFTEHDKADTHILYLCGVVNEALGNQQMAQELYKKSLNLDATNYQALVHLAANLEAQGKRDEAQRLRDRAQHLADKGTA